MPFIGKTTTVNIEEKDNSYFYVKKQMEIKRVDLMNYKDQQQFIK